MPAIQLLPNFQDKAILNQHPPAQSPFYIYLRLDLFHLTGPQGVAAPTSGVSSTWFGAHAKKSVAEKLKGLKQLLVPHIAPQPEVEEDDEIFY